MRLLALLSIILPLPAFALSCLPHGVTDAYLQASDAKEGYVPVLGSLTFDAGLLPKVDWANQQSVPDKTLIPATFAGDALGAGGVPIPFATDVMLEVQCFGPWCPSPQPGQSLAFLRRTSTGYLLHTDACGGFLFSNPSVAQVKQVRDCMAGLRCEPSARR